MCTYIGQNPFLENKWEKGKVKSEKNEKRNRKQHLPGSI
jgi:hypothetical protein